MNITIQCTDCKRRFRLKLPLSGKKFRCPACSKKQVIPWGGFILTRLMHDAATVGAFDIVGIFESLLRDEEQLDAREEVYQSLRAMLESYEIMAVRMHRALYESGVN